MIAINNSNDFHADFTPMLFSGLLSNWALKCIEGNLAEIKKLLREEPRLLDRRESMLRYGGLHFSLVNISNIKYIPDEAFECLKFLVEQGAQVDGRDMLGRNMLWYCLRQYGNPERFELAGYLLEHGADINARDRMQIPLLFLKYDDPECYQWLLKNGADFNALNQDGILFRGLDISRERSLHHPSLPFTQQNSILPSCRDQIELHFQHECESQRNQAKMNGYYRTCFACKRRNTMKRCKKCFLIWYCSKECQVSFETISAVHGDSSVMRLATEMITFFSFMAF